MIALKAWARRAEITCDRAALLASRDLDATLTALTKLELGAVGPRDLDLALKASPGEVGRLANVVELFRAHPVLPKRLAALRYFAAGALYAQVTGGDPSGKPSTTDIDLQVSDLLSVF